MELRSKLVALKERHGLTNQQIADSSGVPLGTVSGIFSGQTARPAFQDVTAILKCMGESVDAFCGFDTHAPAETENAPLPQAGTEHHYHHFSFMPLRGDMREAAREAISDVYSTEAYRILDNHLKWWRTITVVLIALIVAWFTWDITHPDVGLIQYGSTLPAAVSGMIDDTAARV